MIQLELHLLDRSVFVLRVLEHAFDAAVDFPLWRYIHLVRL